MIAINCGVIAARIVQCLAQPRTQRDLLLGANIPEYLHHIEIPGYVDAISYKACRQWRFEHATRLLDWAVRQDQDGAAAPVVRALDMGGGGVC